MLDPPAQLIYCCWKKENLARNALSCIGTYNQEQKDVVGLRCHGHLVLMENSCFDDRWEPGTKVCLFV